MSYLKICPTVTPPLVATLIVDSSDPVHRRINVVVHRPVNQGQPLDKPLCLDDVNEIVEIATANRLRVKEILTYHPELFGEDVHNSINVTEENAFDFDDVLHFAVEYGVRYFVITEIPDGGM